MTLQQVPLSEPEFYNFAFLHLHFCGKNDLKIIAM